MLVKHYLSWGSPKLHSLQAMDHTASHCPIYLNVEAPPLRERNWMAKSAYKLITYIWSSLAVQNHHHTRWQSRSYFCLPAIIRYSASNILIRIWTMATCNVHNFTSGFKFRARLGSPEEIRLAYVECEIILAHSRTLHFTHCGLKNCPSQETSKTSQWCKWNQESHSGTRQKDSEQHGRPVEEQFGERKRHPE